MADTLGLPELVAGRFGIVPTQRYAVNLRTARTTGEALPILGDHFFCVSVDVPCRVTFVTANGEQAYTLFPGFELDGPFYGIVLFNDAISIAGGSGLGPSLVFEASTKGATRRLLDLSPIAYPQPWNVVTQAVGSLVHRVLVPPGAKYLNMRSNMLLQVGGRIVAVVNVQFYDLAGSLIFGYTTNNSGNAYGSTIAPGLTRNVTSVFALAGFDSMDAELLNIPVPYNANQAQVSYSFQPAIVNYISQNHRYFFE